MLRERLAQAVAGGAGRFDAAGGDELQRRAIGPGDDAQPTIMTAPDFRAAFANNRTKRPRMALNQTRSEANRIGLIYSSPGRKRSILHLIRVHPCDPRSLFLSQLRGLHKRIQLDSCADGVSQIGQYFGVEVRIHAFFVLLLLAILIVAGSLGGVERRSHARCCGSFCCSP